MGSPCVNNENAKRFLKEESIESVIEFIEGKRKEFKPRQFYCLAILLLGQVHGGLTKTGTLDEGAEKAFGAFREFLFPEPVAA